MKVPCTTCGAMILPATAGATGGVCMACKNGIRKNLERAKAFYAEQRKPDPARDYWSELVNRVYETPEGFSGLSPVERVYYAVCVFEGEVYNGGVHQFFSNSAGNYYPTVVAGLNELGATRSLELLLQARQALFPDVEPPTDWEARRAVLPWWPEDETAPTPGWSIEIDGINKELWKDSDKLCQRLQDYATRHNLIPKANGA
jgi:hypothetical protein